MNIVNAKYRNSDAYIGSVYPNNENWLDEVNEIRKAVKIANKKGANLRVCLKGREPVHKGWNGHGYHYGGNIVGGLKNAKRVDVYIYNR